MSLILAIEPDRRQAAKVYAVADALHVELVHGETTETALGALGSRVPDLVLTSQLLSPRDEAALADRLRELDAAGLHVSTLVIPVLRGEDGERRKKSGGFFDRLRGRKDDKTIEGCDPAVFGAEITEYLERSAAERAALAQAQADLEAAWADAPAPALEPAVTGDTITSAMSAPAAATEPWFTPDDGETTPVPQATDADRERTDHERTDHEAALDALFASAPVPAVDAAPVAPVTIPGHIDVHPGMVIEDPEALFGEFAAIPIRPPAAPAPIATSDWQPMPTEAPGVAEYENSDIAANFESLFASTARLDGTSQETTAATPRPVTSRPAEEEWEEISLDGGDTPAVSGAAEHTTPEHHVEMHPESLDFDEFVRELETVKSTANAQPMIPVVDLSHVLAGDIDLPEPEVVAETEIREEVRATFEAEVAAVFAAPVPEITFEAEPELAEEPVVAHPLHLDEATTPAMPALTARSIEPPPMPVAPVVPAWPEFPDLKVPTWQAPEEVAPAPERWRTAIESLAAPTPLPVPTADVSVVKEPAFKPGWHDMLSAIRRDIDQVKKEDEPVAVVKPKADFSAEPLVFPKRPTVAASLISNIEPPRAFKQTVEAAAPPPDINAPAAALKKLLDTVVVPKPETTASDAAVADTVVSEAAALQATLSGINVATVAASEKVEALPDLTANPVWAGGAALAESLERVTEEVPAADTMSPERAAPELQTVDFSWLTVATPGTAVDTGMEPLSAAAEPEATQPGSMVPPDETMTLEELERATRPGNAESSVPSAEAEPVLAAEPEPEPALTEVAFAIAAPVAAIEVAEPAAPVEAALALEAVVPAELPPIAAVAPAVVDAGDAGDAAEVVTGTAASGLAEAAAIAGVEDEWKQARASKGRKKRKQAHNRAPVKAVSPAAVAAVEADWGFFDPHKSGFLPLLARLNQVTGGGMSLR